MCVCVVGGHLGKNKLYSFFLLLKWDSDSHTRLTFHFKLDFAHSLSQMFVF